MPINFATLKTELTTDPNGYGYVTTPITEAVGEYNARKLNEVRAGISVNRTVIPAHEVIEAIVAADWTALSQAEKDRISLVISAGDINVQGTNTRAAFLQAFGAGTTTRSNLVALQTRPGSRAEQLFGQSVDFRDVLNALVS